MKVLKIIGMIILVVVILGIGGCVFILTKLNDMNENYYKYITTEGEIEKKYTAMGEKEVSYKEYDASDSTIGKYEIWYPTELVNNNSKYAVVILANGTGVKASSYSYIFKHLASWNFIAVGNEDENTRTGESLEETLKFLISENENKDSIFYQKFDLDNIGLGGHSQGGPAVFNMVTKQEHGYMIKAIYTASATSTYHTSVMKDNWKYDISKVNIPVFMSAGTGFWDAGTAESEDIIPTDENGLAQGICPLWSLEKNYNSLSDSVDKIIARRKDVDHGDTLKSIDGYMTAWFRYYLQNDEIAKEAFTINGELTTNSLYQDVKTNIE